MKRITISPSNLKTFTQCPYRYWAQYIGKQVPWVEAAPQKKGNYAHAIMEDSFRAAIPSNEINWPVELGFMRDGGTLDLVYSLMTHGYSFGAEVKFAVTKDLAPCAYGTPQAFIQCKSDLLGTPPKGSGHPGIYIDWKTGKTPVDELQLYMNALCARALYRVDQWQMYFVYLEQNRREPHFFDFTDPDAELVAKVEGYILDLDEAYTTNTWPKTQNFLCEKWCDVPTCEFRGVAYKRG